MITDYQAKYIAHDLIRRRSSDSTERLAIAVAGAQVDVNPHQVDAALFAFASPLSKGALLADEVGLGKTIEAGLVISQRWAEGKRRILIVVPANLRKQWLQEDGSPNPLPSYSHGSLVSYTGAGEGDVLLGSVSNYAKCDYGETTASTLTCNAPLHIGGPLMSAVSFNATPGPAGPCYGPDGSSCTDTFHIVKNASALNITPNGGCANGSWCALNNASISFTGANAEFANDKYTCILSSTSSYLINLAADSQTPSGFNIQAYNGSGSPIANDTTLGITYACFGI